MRGLQAWDNKQLMYLTLTSLNTTSGTISRCIDTEVLRVWVGVISGSFKTDMINSNKKKQQLILNINKTATKANNG